MIRTFRIPIAFAAAVALAVPASACAQRDERQRIDTTFAFAKDGWLDVSMISGTMTVTGWTKPEVRIVARIQTGYIESSYGPSRITLATRSERYQRNRSRQSDAHYDIMVPIGTRVMASSTSGDIRVRGTAAEVQVHSTSGTMEVVDAAGYVEIGSTSGDIRLERIRGRTRIGTTSGEIQLNEIYGDLQIKSVSSDMKIRRVESSDVRIGTTSGDITYEGAVDPKGSYEITSHSGDVKFAIPANTAANLSLQSYSGDVESAFPMTLQPGQIRARQRGKRMEFVVGGGGARVSITTFSGNITIERGSARAGKEN